MFIYNFSDSTQRFGWKKQMCGKWGVKGAAAPPSEAQYQQHFTS